jgi:hypothetical protein
MATNKAERIARYEKKAFDIKHRLDVAKQFEEGMLAFAALYNGYDFNEKTSFSEFLGNIVLIRSRKEKAYADLLSVLQRVIK